MRADHGQDTAKKIRKRLTPPRPSSSGVNTTEVTTRTDKDKADMSNMAKTLKRTTNQDSSKNQQTCQGTIDMRADPGNRNPDGPK